MDASATDAQIGCKDVSTTYDEIMDRMDADTTVSAELKQKMIRNVMNGRWFSAALDARYGQPHSLEVRECPKTSKNRQIEADQRRLGFTTEDILKGFLSLFAAIGVLADAGSTCSRSLLHSLSPISCAAMSLPRQRSNRSFSRGFIDIRIQGQAPATGRAGPQPQRACPAFYIS